MLFGVRRNTRAECILRNKWNKYYAPAPSPGPASLLGSFSEKRQSARIVEALKPAPRWAPEAGGASGATGYTPQGEWPVFLLE